ncbi:hypothetical protein FA13DRAFT_1725522 [Coprinellus micaceus]|uniref:Uncharacterized protein n=1 Tax=Coprinellus micaceus TaxID=71717 RepID=A0A4Y7TUR2_COPMI|nr:hypothetical protein FA13DRAFT_1725522 [Coprinellus micaceus]
MYVVSTLNANNKSNSIVRAVVCSYGGKFKFVAKSEGYEETVNAIRKAFDLRAETPVTLSTSSLDVCRGKAVEIDEIAYPMLWEFIDEVAITTPEETASTRPNIVTTQESRRKSRISAIAATARRSLAFTARLSDVEGLPLRSLNSSTASVPSPPNDTQEEQAQVELVEAELFDTAAEDQEEEEQYEHIEEPIIKSSKGKGVDNLFDDDEVEEAPRPNRQQAREPSLPPTPSPSSRRAVPATLSLGEPRVKAEVRVKAEKPEPKKSKFKAKAEPEPNVKPTAEAGPKTQRPREASPAPKAKSSRSTKDSQIAIAISGPKDDQRAQFKMRGKHQIQKILKTACATFKLDFERATLHLVDEDAEDDNGDPVTTELPKDKTVLACGITDGAHLVIHIEGEEEEEEDEEEEEAYDY